MDTVRLFVGFDQREAVAYSVFCQSVIERSTLPVAFHPLAKNLLGFERNGTNSFTYSRFLVPSLCDFKGHALYMDGDMIANQDIGRLWEFRDDKPVSVVKHDYRTKFRKKYIGSTLESANDDYPRKNWSSVMLFNCAHPANAVLDRGFVERSGGISLHRFAWLDDGQIGELPSDWNRLVGEEGGPASVHHYTLGIPGIRHYADDTSSWNWHGSLIRSLECAGEDPVAMVTRAMNRVGRPSL